MPPRGKGGSVHFSMTHPTNHLSLLRCTFQLTHYAMSRKPNAAKAPLPSRLSQSASHLSQDRRLIHLGSAADPPRISRRSKVINNPTFPMPPEKPVSASPREAHPGNIACHFATRRNEPALPRPSLISPNTSNILAEKKRPFNRRRRKRHRGLHHD